MEKATLGFSIYIYDMANFEALIQTINVTSHPEFLKSVHVEQSNIFDIRVSR